MMVSRRLSELALFSIESESTQESNFNSVLNFPLEKREKLTFT